MPNIYNLQWTEEATETFDQIVLTIENKWGTKQAGVFVRRVQRVLQLITQQPYLFKASITNNLRQAVISKQTSMFYEITSTTIIILFLG